MMDFVVIRGGGVTTAVIATDHFAFTTSMSCNRVFHPMDIRNCEVSKLLHIVTKKTLLMMTQDFTFSIV